MMVCRFFRKDSPSATGLKTFRRLSSVRLQPCWIRFCLLAALANASGDGHGDADATGHTRQHVLISIALPAPVQTIVAPSNIHRLPPVNPEMIPTAPPLKDCSVIDSTPRRCHQPSKQPHRNRANVQPMPSRLAAPAFSTQSSAPSTLSWYLIHTKPRQEALALTNLSRQGFECYMPMLRLQKIRQRKTALVAEPMFPRYLFIRLCTPEIRSKLVTDSLYPGREPVGTVWWPASQG